MPIHDKAAATAEVAKSFRFDGQVAVVTGAARGIGAEIAERLLCLGAKVVLADRAPEVEATAAAFRERGFDTDFVVFDVTDSAAVDKAVDAIERKHGGVGVLIANAGIAYEKKAVEHTDEEWRRVMNINLDGVFFHRPGLRAADAGAGQGRDCRHLLDRGREGGAAGTACGLRRIQGPASPISAGSWAWSGPSRASASTRSAPGYTDTEMLGEVGRSNPVMMAMWLGDTPTGRLMQPAEIAAGVTFLACDAASGITGQLLMVDGGLFGGLNHPVPTAPGQTTEKSMIIERRRYTLRPGTLQRFWAAQATWNTEAVFGPILAKNIAYFSAVTGPADQIVHLYRFDSLEDWQQRYAGYYAAQNPDYFALVRPLMLRQDNGFLVAPPGREELARLWAGERLILPDALPLGQDPLRCLRGGDHDRLLSRRPAGLLARLRRGRRRRLAARRASHGEPRRAGSAGCTGSSIIMSSPVPRRRRPRGMPASPTRDGRPSWSAMPPGSPPKRCCSSSPRRSRPDAGSSRTAGPERPFCFHDNWQKVAWEGSDRDHHGRAFRGAGRRTGTTEDAVSARLRCAPWR